MPARALPVGVDDGQVQTVGDANGDHASLKVVLPAIFDFKCQAIEDERRKFESNPRSSRLASLLASCHSKRTVEYTSVYTTKASAHPADAAASRRLRLPPEGWRRFLAQFLAKCSRPSSDEFQTSFVSGATDGVQVADRPRVGRRHRREWSSEAFQPCGWPL